MQGSAHQWCPSCVRWLRVLKLLAAANWWIVIGFCSCIFCTGYTGYTGLHRLHRLIPHLWHSMAIVEAYTHIERERERERNCGLPFRSWWYRPTCSSLSDTYRHWPCVWRYFTEGGEVLQRFAFNIETYLKIFIVRDTVVASNWPIPKGIYLNNYCDAVTETSQFCLPLFSPKLLTVAHNVKDVSFSDEASWHDSWKALPWMCLLFWSLKRP